MNPKVFIITINYNQSRYTSDCIISLLDSDFKDFKLFLIDNGSTFENYQLLRSTIPKDERIIVSRLEDNIGYVGGINHGLMEGKKHLPDYFVILNNDTIIHKSSLSVLVDSIGRNGDRAIVAGKVYEMDRPNVIQTIGTKFTNRNFLKEFSPGKGQEDKGEYENEEEMDIVDDILWIMPAKIIDEVGLYSKYFFFGGEQADFVLRAKAKGYKIIYTSSSKIWHKGGSTYNTSNKTSTLFVYHSMMGSLIYQYRNTKLIYFLIIITKIIIKTFLKYFYSNSEIKQLQKAKFKAIVKSLKMILINIIDIKKN